MRRRFGIAFGMVLLGLLTAFLIDYGLLRQKLARNQGLGSVTVHTYYSVLLKNGKREYSYGGDQVVECVNSAFPHSGDKPCWYARRHTSQEINIESGKPGVPSVF